MTPVFFFGSLRDHALLEIVLGRTVEPAELVAARAPGFAALRLTTEAYPYLAEADGAVAEGVLAKGLSQRDIDRLTYFEEAEYGLSPIDVEAPGGSVQAQYFRATGKAAASDGPWSFDDWVLGERDVALAAAEELMAHIDLVPVEEMDTIWPGVMTRARMRARARQAPPVPARLRQGGGREDVDSVSINRPYTGYFAIEGHVLRYRRFDGEWSDPVQREVFASGDAVTVLPFDPWTGEVLLIEQFRAPIYSRGDHSPWSIEMIAGRIDQELDAAACARREATEEAGLRLGPLEQIAAYYSAPGFAAEHITSFVAPADLSESGGVFGLASENEDIRAFAVPLDKAMAAVTSGEINNAPAILSLLWLQQHASRLIDMAS